MELFYSVMQSDGNRFVGYVVLDSFNMASRVEKSILYPNKWKQIGSVYYYDD